MEELLNSPVRAAKRFYLAGVPPSLRPQVWLQLTHARELAFHNRGLYAFLCSKESKYQRQISSDIARTLPGVAEFGRDQQQMLFRVLSAYSLYCTDVGYSQGLNYVVAPLILMLDDEDEIFWMMVALMKDRNLERFFHADGIYFRIVNDTMEELLRAHFPSLARQIRDCGVTPELYLPQWFRTFFLYSDNLELNLRTMDVFLLHGVEGLFRIALAIFAHVQEAQLASNFMNLTSFLHSLQPLPDISLLMTTAYAQNLTFLTHSLEITYRAEREKQRDKPCLFQ